MALALQGQTNNWVHQNPTGTKPTYNGWYSTVWDPINNTLITYANNGSGSIYSNMVFQWKSDTNEWINTWYSGTTTQDCDIHVNTDTGPRDAHPVQNAWLDLNRNRLYYVPGVCQSVDPDDMYYRPLSTSYQNWVRMPLGSNPDTCGTAGWKIPCTTRYTASAYNPTRDVVVTFGYDSAAGTGNTSVFCASESSLTAAQTAAGCTTANAWKSLSPSSDITPGDARFYQGMYIGNDKAIFIGSVPEGVLRVWEYDYVSQAYTERSTSGGPPSPNSAVTSNSMPVAWVSGRSTIYLHRSNGSARQDWKLVYASSGTLVWTNLGDLGGPMYAESMQYDPNKSRLVISGSETASGASTSIWTRDIPLPLQ